MSGFFATVIRQETIEGAVQEIKPSFSKLGDDRFLRLYLELLTGLNLSASGEPQNAKNGVQGSKIQTKGDSNHQKNLDIKVQPW